MNIFVLDKNPLYAAQYHCDKHVVKMVLETAQILSTVAVSKIPKAAGYLYRPTHRNHPCTIWAGESFYNTAWLCSLGINLANEYQYRYDKVHKSKEIITRAYQLLMGIDSLKWAKDDLTPFAQAMPSQYQNEDAVKAYRDYYKNEKTKLLTYTRRGKPEWLKTQ